MTDVGRKINRRRLRLRGGRGIPVGEVLLHCFCGQVRARYYCIVSAAKCSALRPEMGVFRRRYTCQTGSISVRGREGAGPWQKAAASSANRSQSFRRSNEPVRRAMTDTCTQLRCQRDW